MVNYRYLSDGLTAIGTPKTRFKLNDGNSAMLVVPEGGDEVYRYLVMPIRN